MIATAAGEDGSHGVGVDGSHLLGYLLWVFEGRASASLVVMRETVASARGRGLVGGRRRASLGSTLDALVDAGEFDEALRGCGCFEDARP